MKLDVDRARARTVRFTLYALFFVAIVVSFENQRRLRNQAHTTFRLYLPFAVVGRSDRRGSVDKKE